MKHETELIDGSKSNKTSGHFLILGWLTCMVKIWGMANIGFSTSFEHEHDTYMTWPTIDAQIETNENHKWQRHLTGAPCWLEWQPIGAVNSSWWYGFLK